MNKYIYLLFFGIALCGFITEEDFAGKFGSFDATPSEVILVDSLYESMNLDERIGALITMMQHNGRLDDLITAINPQQKGSGHTGGYAGVVQARIPFPGDRA